MMSKNIYKLKFFLLLIVLSGFGNTINAQEKANGSEVIIQGFNWLSYLQSGGWYNLVLTKTEDLGESQIDAIWLPPPSKSNAMAAQGYLPSELNNLNSAYGTETELITLISSLHTNNVKAIADIVINHRVGTNDWADFTNPTWGCWAVVQGDEWTGACGGYDTGAGYGAARDLDHNNTTVRNDLKTWMSMLKNTVGFDGWRYDYVKGFSGSYIQEYNNNTSPWFVVGECWEDYNTIVNWLNSSGSDTKAFDFLLKGTLQNAFNDNNLSYLNAYGNMPGISGTHPSRSVTFLENHDTGYPQNHWPFPDAKVLQGYAYILTHPGTPMIFWNHYYEWGIHDQIKTMIQIRKANGIHSTSTLNIQKSDWNCYAAIIDNKVAMKIGPGSWTPTGAEWILATSGTDYAIWTKTSLEAPVVTINPAEGHYVDPITVTITASDNDDTNPTIYYTTNGTTPTISSTSGSSPVSFEITDTTTVKAIAIDDANHTSSEISKTYTIGAIPGFTIHVKNKTSWGANPPYIYYWAVSPAGAMLGVIWPGVQMNPEGSNWYYYYFPSVLSANMIFSNNGTDQTANLEGITTDKWYDLNTGSWISQPNLAPLLTFSPLGGAFNEAVNVTITATDDSDPNPVFYYTTDGSTPTVSSESATNYLTLHIAENTTIKAISEDEDGNISDVYSQTYQFVEGGFKVHLKKPANWTAAKIYYWTTLPAGIMPVVQWPGVDMIVEGNGWYYYSFPGVTSTNLIFNNGLSGAGNQTEDLFADTDLWYDNGFLHAPNANSVTISGDLIENSLLQGNYVYAHEDEIDEALSTFKWYRAFDSEGTGIERILTAVDDSYSTNYNDVNKYLAFSVIPVDANGISGDEVMSQFYGPIEDTYTLTFNVSDGTNTIDGAQISINSEMLTTAAGGIASISLTAGEYPFTVNASGFDEYSANVSITNFDKTIDVILQESAYIVNFIVTDGTNPLQNTQINVNSEVLITNVSGIASTNLLNGNYDYLATKAGYNSTEGTITVDGETLNENIVLTQSSNLFTVTFDVSDGVNPVSGAEIVIAGSTLYTNSSGLATINLANGTYPYVLNADGYDVVEDEIVVNSANVTEEIVLATVYLITFSITDGLNPIENAGISINDEILTSDIDGFATINLPNGTFPFTVYAENFEVYTGDVIISGMEQTVDVILIALPTISHTTFIVNDSQYQTYTGFELKGSWSPEGIYDQFWNYGNILSYFYDDGTHGDVVAGDYIWATTFDLVPDGGANIWEWGVNNQNGVWIDGNFEFSVTDGSPQTLIFDLTDYTKYLVTFEITDGTDAISTASIQINGINLTSNSEGVATIELPDGIYPYTVLKAGYYQVSGEITVSGSVITEEVILTEATNLYIVTFYVSDGSSPISGANIQIAGEGINTNLSGEAVIELADGNYNYTVSASGYLPGSGNIMVIGSDLTENIVLTAVDIVNIENQFNIYPNPTSGFLNISTVLKITDVEIYDVTGKLIKKISVKSENEINIDLSEISSGMLMIKVQTENFGFKYFKIQKN